MDRLEPEQLEEYGKLFKYLTPIPKLGKYQASDLYELEFAEVVNIKEAIREERFYDAMTIYFKCPLVFLMKFRILQYSHALNYMMKDVNALLDRESKALSKEPEQEWVAAGVRELDKFGALNVLDALGVEYGKSPNEIETWSYGLVFGLLWRRTTKADIHERYRELTKNKK